MNDVVRILKAADFAARKHTEQRRKGEKSEPYLNHLVEVASLVAETTNGDSDIVIAALLHDAVEDQDVPNDEIRDLFGPAVASLVAELTDDKTLRKRERKDKQVENAPHKSRDASVIKLADKTSNLRAIATSPPPWPLDRKRAYVDWAKAVVAGLPFKPSALFAQFEASVALAEDACGMRKPTQTDPTRRTTRHRDRRRLRSIGPARMETRIPCWRQ